MNVPHPLDSIPRGWPSAAVFVALLALELFTMSRTAGNLKTPESPYNAISLELAWGEPRAQAIVGAWKREKMIDEAHRHLRSDNVFILFYSTLAAFGCVIAARTFFTPGTGAYNAAMLVAWLPWLAGLLDYAENYGISRMLGGFEGAALPLMTSACATLKFLIIVPLALYGLCGVFVAAKRALLG